MAVKEHISRLRSVMAVLCIAMFLFSYVNSSMFWHYHYVKNNFFFHSHMCGSNHRTSHTDGGHTATQLILLETVSYTTLTDAAVVHFDIEPFRLEEVRTVTPSDAFESICLAFYFSRRGPPVLV